MQRADRTHQRVAGDQRQHDAGSERDRDGERRAPREDARFDERIFGRLIDGDDPAEVGNFGGRSETRDVRSKRHCAEPAGNGGLDQRRCREGSPRGHLLAAGREHHRAGAIDHRRFAARAEPRLGDERQEPGEAELDRQHRTAAGSHRYGDAGIAGARGVRRTDGRADLQCSAQRNASRERGDVGRVEHRPIGERRIVRARREIDRLAYLRALRREQCHGRGSFDLAEDQPQRARALVGPQFAELHRVRRQRRRVQARAHLGRHAFGEEACHRLLRGAGAILEGAA